VYSLATIAFNVFGASSGNLVDPILPHVIGDLESNGSSSNEAKSEAFANSTTTASEGESGKKRKREKMDALSRRNNNNKLKQRRYHSRGISVKISSCRTLESILINVGAYMNKQARNKVDLLLIGKHLRCKRKRGKKKWFFIIYLFSWLLLF